jgi:hypothetical protein
MRRPPAKDHLTLDADCAADDLGVMPIVGQ